MGPIDIMHVFIEVLLVGIGVAAVAAALLVCRIQQRKAKLRVETSQQHTGAHTGGRRANGLHSGVSIQRGPEDSALSANRNVREKAKLSSRNLSDFWSRISTVRDYTEGIEIEVGALCLLALLVVGQLSATGSPLLP